jgi:putative DNA primase/helicase
MTITELKSNTDIVEVVGKYVQLRRQGREYIGKCPFHNDTHPSLSVVPSKQKFFCPVCQTHGDVLDFVGQIENVNLTDAARIISGGGYQPPMQSNYDDNAAQEWQWVGYDYQGDVPPAFDSMKGKVLDAIYDYCDTFKVYRFIDDDGRKQIRPATLRRNAQGHISWRWQGLSDGRPLWNLQRILNEPDAQVVVVEGEKTACALQAKFNKVIVTTWHGGCTNVHKSDWSPLIGRVHYVWPDNDAIGHAAMAAVCHLTKSNAVIVGAPEDAPKGWDYADVQWSAKDTAAWIKSFTSADIDWQPCPKWLNGNKAVRYERFNKIAWCAIGDGVTVREQPQHVTDVIDVNGNVVDDEQPIELHDEMPFRFLGYSKVLDNIIYYYYAVESKVVMPYTQNKFTTNGLLALAPVEFWQARYESKSGFDLNAATNWLIRASYAVGIFNPDKIRGRGAWIDGGRVVVHRGDALVVDGIEHDVTRFDSRYIYELSDAMRISIHGTFNDNAGRKLLDALTLISWERPQNAALLAGWCVVAPVCGALNWRPHVWITGGAGTGKSWIMTNIVERLMSSIAVVVEGETTGAGIRQHLGSDALPIVFDEAEAEDKASLDRIEQILNLMRIASTETGAKVLKGSSSHMAKSFNVRSCFLFASIIYQARKQADLTRVTVLGLRSSSTFSQERFDKLRELITEVITDDFVDGFHARTMQNLPTLLHNIEVFRVSAAKVLKSQRMADQIAPLCAGAWLLTSTERVTEDAADAWFSAHDWSSEMGLQETRDEMQCLSYILEQVVNVEAGDYGSKLERTVGELISMCCDGGVSPSDRSSAEARLKRFGIRVEGTHYIISNGSKNIQHVLKGTQWEKNHGKVLQRVDGAEVTTPMQFSAGHVSRGVKLRWSGSGKMAEIPVLTSDAEDIDDYEMPF